MKWFDRWIMKRAERLMVNEAAQPEASQWALPSAKIKRATLSSGNSVGDSLDSPAVRFKMFKASGGTIIETTMYDDHKDRHINGLYVITNDKDLGAEIGKILTMESLKI
jgi:hypothetical protein